MPREVKKCVFLFGSSSCARRPLIKKLLWSLQVSIAESEVISWGLRRAIDEEETKRNEFAGALEASKPALNRAHELYKEME